MGQNMEIRSRFGKNHSKKISFENPKSYARYEGCGGGLVVSILAFYSDGPSLNPAGN